MEGFSAGLADDSNIFEWEIVVVGPPYEIFFCFNKKHSETLYEGGMWKAEMKFPPEYPNKPPTLKFVTPIYHPNGNLLCTK